MASAVAVMAGVVLSFACGGDEDSATVSMSANAGPANAPTSEQVGAPVRPFTDVAADALKQGFEVWNDRPGVAVFDFDRDGDLDFYLTSEAGHPNWLYRNEGDGTFTDLAEQAGLAAVMHRIMIEEASQFIPPYEGRVWLPLLLRYMPRH